MNRIHSKAILILRILSILVNSLLRVFLRDFVVAFRCGRAERGCDGLLLSNFLCSGQDFLPQRRGDAERKNRRSEFTSSLNNSDRHASLHFLLCASASLRFKFLWLRRSRAGIWSFRPIAPRATLKFPPTHFPAAAPQSEPRMPSPG